MKSFDSIFNEISLVGNMGEVIIHSLEGQVRQMRALVLRAIIWMSLLTLGTMAGISVALDAIQRTAPGLPAFFAPAVFLAVSPLFLFQCRTFASTLWGKNGLAVKLVEASEELVRMRAIVGGDHEHI